MEAKSSEEKPGLKAVFLTGVVAVSPFLVLIYVIFHALRTIGTALSPLAERLGIIRILGEIGLFLLLLLPLIALFFLGGWLVLRRGEGAAMKWASGVALKLVPGLAELKKRQEQLLVNEQSRKSLRAVLVECEGVWKPARVVEENSDWVVLAFPKNSEELENTLEIHQKSSLILKSIDDSVFKTALEHDGAGFLGMI